MSELSIFVDESGDFGEAKIRSAYYLVTFVFHNQNIDIGQQVARLEEGIKLAGFEEEYIHTGPVIRREEVFAKYNIDDRRKLLYKMLNFVNNCSISCLTVVIDRKEAINKVDLSGKLAKLIKTTFMEHQEYFFLLTKL